MNDNKTKVYAGFWQRAGAFALDYVIILFYLMAITLLSLLTNSLINADQSLFTDRIRAQVAGFVLITLPITLYFSISESSIQQATWGKRRVKLKVSDHNGGRIGFLRSLARTSLKFIPWELSHTLIWEIYFKTSANETLINMGFVLVYVLIGLNLASLVLTKTHQTLYDFIAGTRVDKLQV